MPTKNENLDTLLFGLIGDPFTTIQQEVVFSEARALFSEGGLITQFVDVVMAPEMFLRNYQTFFTISKSEAQQDMKNPNGCTYASDSSTELFID